MGWRVPQPRQVLVTGAVLVVVVASDQASKWLAWRHIDSSLINRGGSIALGPRVRAWFAEPVWGAVADGIGLALVLAGLLLMLRRPRPRPVLLAGAAIGAGWISNLLDRLGLHEWTAPGSQRGVVDFIPTGGRSAANVADAWIVVGVLVFTGRWVRAALTSRRS